MGAKNQRLERLHARNKQQKALLTDFLEVYDKNIEKGFNYLIHRFFLEKEKELIERILK